MDTNNFQKFFDALDNYEKARAKRDYQSACEHLVAAIECNPYPTLYDYLSQSLAVARESYYADLEATKPRGFFGRLQIAMHNSLLKSS